MSDNFFVQHPEVMRYIGPFGLGSVAAYRERIRTNWSTYYSAHPARGVWAAIEVVAFFEDDKLVGLALPAREFT